MAESDWDIAVTLVEGLDWRDWFDLHEPLESELGTLNWSEGDLQLLEPGQKIVEPSVRRGGIQLFRRD